MSGGVLGEGSLLRERTLTPPGDVVPSFTDWQGWPAHLVGLRVVEKEPPRPPTGAAFCACGDVEAH
jgi:hypothetical protein